MDHDPETVRAAVQGDPAAFDSLFKRNLPALVAFIRSRLGERLAARESASDLAQSVCRELLEDLDDFEYRDEAGFRGWVYQQAARKILDRNRYYGRARRDIDREAPGPSLEDDVPALVECYATLGTPSRHASAREQLERLEGAIQQLPEAQRDAVMMSRVLWMSYPDIAGIMGITEASVRGLVARGLAAVAEQLE